MVLPPNPYIPQLIRQGEHERLDFKYEISDARKIARTFSAFSNCSGGTLLIGVKDNGRIAGIRSEEEYYMAESAASLYCKPAVLFTAEKWMVDGKMVLEIKIPVVSEKPVMVKEEDGHWKAYYRVTDQNIKANAVQLKVWKQKKSAVFIRYSRDEELLLEYLTQHEIITLSRFVKLARLRHFEAENILANLILSGVIHMEISVNSVQYSLVKK
jgi:predicted HTH transcriptional regulator